MRAILLLIATLLLPSGTRAGNAQTFQNLGPVGPVTWSGPAEAIDGDTLMLGGHLRVRLWGIDAPERSQTCEGSAGAYECGRDASASLAALLRDRTVTCVPKDRDRYGRTVATCSTEEAGDIGSAMVAAGWAIDWPKYSKGRYAAEQAEAKAAKRGIWSGRFEMPEQWRKARR